MRAAMRYIGSLVISLLLPTLAMSGCKVEPVEGDAVAAKQSALAMDSDANLALVTDFLFSAPPFLGQQPVAEAHARIVTGIEDGLRFLFGSVECVTIDTDGPNDIALIFDGCASEMAEFDGEIHANIEFETRACLLTPNEQCPVVIIYRVEPILYDDGISRLAGGFELRVPVDASLARSTGGSFAFDHAEGASLTFDGRSTWTEAGGCVDLSWDAELTLNEEAMVAIDTDVATVAATARGIERCWAACPTRGTLDIAFDHGDILQITYDGTPHPQVAGPRGVAHDVELPCNPAP